MAQGCDKPWAVSVLAGNIRLQIREAVFNRPLAETYEEWAAQGQFLLMCHEHYRSVYRKDGYTLGYRQHNGKLRAYVRERHY